GVEVGCDGNHGLARAGGGGQDDVVAAGQRHRRFVLCGIEVDATGRDPLAESLVDFVVGYVLGVCWQIIGEQHDVPSLSVENCDWGLERVYGASVPPRWTYRNG